MRLKRLAAAGILGGLVACSGSPSGPGPIDPGPPAPAPNTPPVIEAVTASVTRTEVNVPVTFTAVVSDRETAPQILQYEWEAEKGTIDGTGATVTWVLPKGSETPVDCKVTVRVRERYPALDAAGNPIEREHSVSSVSPLVRVHDSPAEIEALALAFLDDFADSSVDADDAVRHFSDNCPGKLSEFRDIEANREALYIEDADYEVTSVTLNATRTRADVLADCEFWDRDLTTGMKHHSTGQCLLTAVYEEYHWQLCDSRFHGTTTPVGPGPTPPSTPPATTTSLGRLGRLR